MAKTFKFVQENGYENHIKGLQFHLGILKLEVFVYPRYRPDRLTTSFPNATYVVLDGFGNRTYNRVSRSFDPLECLSILKSVLPAKELERIRNLLIQKGWQRWLDEEAYA